VILISKTYWGGAPFSFRRRPPGAQVESLELRADDFRRFRALLWLPEGGPRPRVAVVAMHPRVDFTHHYSFPRLLAAGIACLGANTRHPNNDLDTVHEEIVLDLAACVKYLRGKGGFERVVLLGNSGGGSLAALLQSQARLPAAERIAETPGGKPTRLAMAEMTPADGLVIVAAHPGQGRVLGQCLDPAVVDEDRPLETDPALDMYDPRNGFQPPAAWSRYPEEFVTRYRAAQTERVRRLDARARELIAAGRAARDQRESNEFTDRPVDERLAIERRAFWEPVMTVYRTMANLHYTDNTLDPSPREYGSLLSDRPDLMNLQLLGFGRVVTPHAWLSTWSALSSNADMMKTLPGVAEPTLMVHAGRDKEIYPTEAREMFAALAADDKTFVDLPEARHYFEPDFGQTEAPQVEALLDTVVPWIRDRFM
jgi:alpha-beta hydrolase superfamily lysophospholipase